MSETPSTLPPAAAADSYWAQSRRPLTSLAFVVPLLVAYEGGMLVLGRHAVRNGADVWMRELIAALGFGQYFLLPILTIGILLGWHHMTGQPWRVSRRVLYGMAAESVLLALCLRLLLHVQGRLMPAAIAGVRLSIFDAAGTVIGYLGAGIYEELLFRLVLLSALAGLLRWAKASPGASMAGAIVLSSLLFATSHYVGPYGDPFALFSFTFRFVAGAFFSALFVYRGFGIAAGSHAGYDVLVGLSAVFG